MSESTDRPFSRFYAQLRRAAEGVDEEGREESREEPEWIGAPDLANPKRRADEDS